MLRMETSRWRVATGQPRSRQSCHWEERPPHSRRGVAERQPPSARICRWEERPPLRRTTHYQFWSWIWYWITLCLLVTRVKSVLETHCKSTSFAPSLRCIIPSHHHSHYNSTSNTHFHPCHRNSQALPNTQTTHINPLSSPHSIKHTSLPFIPPANHRKYPLFITHLLFLLTPG